MNDNLPPLPCPFCGEQPKTTERPDNIDGTQFFFAVGCYCGTYSASAHKMAVRNTPEQAMSDAISAWNARAAIERQSVPESLSDYELSELAHSANQEALSYGLSHDVFLRYFKTLRDKALSAAPQPQPVRQALQAEGKHPAPCARFCEATAFSIKIRGLEKQLAERQSVPAGYVLVPIEPTEAMTDATYVGQHCSDIWRDMIAAAPQPQPVPGSSWIAIADQMPPPEGRYLVWFDNCLGIANTFTKWKHPSNPLGYLIQGHGGSHNSVTHWMSLPEKPAQGEKQ